MTRHLIADIEVSKKIINKLIYGIVATTTFMSPFPTTGVERFRTLRDTRSQLTWSSLTGLTPIQKVAALKVYTRFNSSMSIVDLPKDLFIK